MDDIDIDRLKTVVELVGRALDGVDAMNLTAIGAKLSDVQELLIEMLERG